MNFLVTFRTLKLKERGILSRLFKMYKRSKVPTCETESHFIVPQTIRQLFLAYAVLGGGFVVGLVFLVVEIVLWRMSGLGTTKPTGFVLAEDLMS